MPKPKTYTQLGHFLLEDSMNNKSSLILRINEATGFISYVMYRGHGSSGIGYSLSNLLCELPYETLTDDETIDEFKARLVRIMNSQSGRRVIRERKTVKF